MHRSSTIEIAGIVAEGKMQAENVSERIPQFRLSTAPNGAPLDVDEIERFEHPERLASNAERRLAQRRTLAPGASARLEPIGR